VKDQLTNTIKSKKKSYVQDKITSADQSQKALFQCMNELLFKSNVNSLPTNIPPEDQPNKFCNFFLEKIEKIQSIFTTTEDECVQNTTPCQHLLDFDLATPEEIKKIILKSPTKSCTLDPFPTFLLKDCLDEVAPLITAIVNASITSGRVPELFKKAVVTPLLKKSSLDPDVLANYRPVSNVSFQRFLRKWCRNGWIATRLRMICMNPFSLRIERVTLLRQQCYASKTTSL